jgi:hypothetical protein
LAVKLRINLLLRGKKYVNSPLLYFQRIVDGVRSGCTEYAGAI